MVKDVVKLVSVGYGCYQEIENPTPHKFFFCRYYNMDFLLVCTYEENGENPELVIYKKR